MMGMRVDEQARAAVEDVIAPEPHVLRGDVRERLGALEARRSA